MYTDTHVYTCTHTIFLVKRAIPQFRNGANVNGHTGAGTVALRKSRCGVGSQTGSVKDHVVNILAPAASVITEQKQP